MSRRPQAGTGLQYIKEQATKLLAHTVTVTSALEVLRTRRFEWLIQYTEEGGGLAGPDKTTDTEQT